LIDVLFMSCVLSVEGATVPSGDTGISTELVIGVVAGVSGALLVCVVVLVGYCIHIRRTR